MRIDARRMSVAAITKGARNGVSCCVVTFALVVTTRSTKWVDGDNRFVGISCLPLHARSIHGSRCYSHCDRDTDAMPMVDSIIASSATVSCWCHIELFDHLPQY